MNQKKNWPKISIEDRNVGAVTRDSINKRRTETLWLTHRDKTKFESEALSLLEKEERKIVSTSSSPSLTSGISSVDETLLHPRVVKEWAKVTAIFVLVFPSERTTTLRRLVFPRFLEVFDTRCTTVFLRMADHSEANYCRVVSSRTR